jgi:hypothetical protein
MLPAAVIVAVEYAVALAIGLGVGFHYSIPLGAYLLSSIIVAGVTVCGMALWKITGVRGDDTPLSSVLRRYGEVTCGIVLVGLQMGVLAWLKIMLPIAQGFWADPLLAHLDSALFLGIDPWRITHALFWWAPLDQAYITWAPVKFAVLLALLLAPASNLRSRALLSYFLILCVGSLGQYLLPSAGPIFYSALELGPRFADLPIAPWAKEASAYLWADHLRGGGHIGTGISAMPSLHVAIALWLALVLRSYFPRLQAIGWVYFGLIFVGSIHLGWHYAVDSIAGSALALLAFRLAEGPSLRRTMPMTRIHSRPARQD